MATKKKDIFKDVQVLQLTRAIIFLIGVVVLIAVLRTNTVPVNALLITKDALASQATTVFVPGLKYWFDAPIAYMSAAALLVSAIVAMYRYSRGKDTYKQELRKGNSPLKWVELGVTSAIIIEIVALFAGVSDPGVVKMCAGALVVTCALGWLADRQNAGAKKPDWSAYGISVLSGFLPWLAIGSSLIFTALYGMVRLPWYSYMLAGAMLVGFCALALNQRQGIRKVGASKQYMFVERNYLAIDILIKVAFVVILVVGLRG